MIDPARLRCTACALVAKRRFATRARLRPASRVARAPRHDPDGLVRLPPEHQSGRPAHRLRLSPWATAVSSLRLRPVPSGNGPSDPCGYVRVYGGARAQRPFAYGQGSCVAGLEDGEANQEDSGWDWKSVR